MAARRVSRLREGDIVGQKYFDRLMPLLERLHDVGTRRDRAENRQLFFDQYCAYILLFLFNPIVTSPHGIHQASALKKGSEETGLSARLVRLALRGGCPKLDPTTRRPAGRSTCR